MKNLFLNNNIAIKNNKSIDNIAIMPGSFHVTAAINPIMNSYDWLKIVLIENSIGSYFNIKFKIYFFHFF